MSDKTDLNQTEDLDNKNNSSSIDQSRRKFTQAGVAAPIIMSLASQPVWGTECSLSGFMSGNVSGRVHECAGSGCTPGFWKNNYHAWATTNYVPGQCVTVDNKGDCTEWNTENATTFIDVFGFAPSTQVDGETPQTMMQVLQKEVHINGSSSSYESHLIAFALNASSNPVAFGATQQQLANALDAVANGEKSEQDLFDVVVSMNEQGECFLNSRGECASDAVANEAGNCIPACSGNNRYDFCSNTCVPRGTEKTYLDYLNGNC